MSDIWDLYQSQSGAVFEFARPTHLSDIYQSQSTVIYQTDICLIYQSDISDLYQSDISDIYQTHSLICLIYIKHIVLYMRLISVWYIRHISVWYITVDWDWYISDRYVGCANSNTAPYSRIDISDCRLRWIYIRTPYTPVCLLCTSGYLRRGRV